MDNGVLKKRLSTHRTDGGSLKNMSDDLLMDILRAWESWPGSLKDFYISIGVTSMQMAKLMGKAKKLRREGRYPEGDFKELKLDSVIGAPSGNCGIELSWTDGKVIRFGQVELLIDFLKKVA